jgi:hypothetical protein
MSEELYRTLMDKGFLIYGDGANFVLEKSVTPADTRTAITNEIVPCASRIVFESHGDALQKAKELINWKDKQSAAVQTGNTCWFMQLMCQHKSGPKFVDLGEMGAVPYSVALDEAKERATRYIEESYEEEDIEGWDVRVRPRPIQNQ